MSNKTLVGLTLDGNELRIDADGVVRLLEDRKDIIYTVKLGNTVGCKIGKGLGSKTLKYKQYVEGKNKHLKMSMNWVKEGWVPFDVKCSISKNDNKIGHKIELKQPVFIFFEFDNFKPWLIEPDDKKEFNTRFMIPPGNWRF